MLKSMTGFGRGEGETSLGRVFVECRSVNHRYCDINLKLPRRLAAFENRIKELLRSEVSRGRIDLTVKLEAAGEEKVQLGVDLHLAEQYYRALETLKEKLGLGGEIGLDLLAGAKDLITVKEEPADIEPYWKEFLPILKQAIQDMDRMKQLEGETLSKDLVQRVEKIKGELETVKEQFPVSLQTYGNRLQERIRSLLGNLELDPSRFQQEVAFLAERMDITEELIRAESHLVHFSKLLQSGDPVGRKMDFLLQEIHREINTISSKANDAEISQRVVEIKSEIEKIREQAQNIE